MIARRHLGRATAVASLVLGLIGPVPDGRAVTYPAPPPRPEVTPATLPDHYATSRQAVRQALAIAREESDRERAGTLASLLGRDLLYFDARGNGRAVEVIGDLPAADRIAVVVPGSHTTLDTFDHSRGPGGGARALTGEIAARAPGTRLAALAWLGYDTPQGASYRSLTDHAARAAAPALRDTVTDLRRVNPAAPITLLCHSYGSVVCANAVPDLPVDDLVLYGSPGVGVATAEDLDTPARVWAARADADWIRFVPSARLARVGFGPDPAEPSFGAQPFPAGDGGHGDYHLRGGEALRSLARIVVGEGVTNHG